MGRPKSIEHILTVSGRPEQLRAFKRIAYASHLNPLDFFNILPVETFSDQELYEHSCQMTYGIKKIPRKVKVLKNEEGKVVYAFRSQKQCNVSFMPYRFPELDFELYLPEENKHVAITKDGFKNDYYVSKPQKSYIPVGLPSLLDTLIGKSVALIITDDPGNLNPDVLPFDFVLHNELDFYHFGHPSIPIVTKTSEKTIYIKTNPVALLRWLNEYKVKLECFIGLGEHIHHSVFFELLSPLLSDNSWYFADRLFSLSSLERGYLCLNYLSHYSTKGFPNLNFYSLPVNHNEMPFDPGLLPCAEQYDDMPSDAFDFEDESLPIIKDKTPFSVCNLYRISRTSPITEIRNIGNIEVSVSNASVWEFENDFDCIVPYQLYPWGIEDYLPKNKKIELILNYDWVRNRPFKLFLEEAFLEKWRSIGIAIDLDQDYLKSFQTIKRWNKKYPEKVHFFIMDRERKEEISTLLQTFFYKK